MKNNYYAIHKNKSPKPLRRRRKGYVSLLAARLAVINSMSALQVSIIASQPIPKYLKGGHPVVSDGEMEKLGKNSKVLNILTDTAFSIAKEVKMEKVYRFKATGRYIK